jgi:hypothetical protein
VRPSANHVPVRPERGRAEEERQVLSRRFDRKRKIGRKEKIRAADKHERTNQPTRPQPVQSDGRFTLRRALTLEYVDTQYGTR